MQHINVFESIRRTSYHFAFAIPAAGSGRLSKTIPAPCTIEKMTIRIYPGAVLNVHLDPYILKTNNRRYNVIDYVSGGKQYIDGDNDTLIFDVGHPAQVDDQLVVDYINIDAVNAYDFVVDFEVDFFRGMMRSNVPEVKR